MPTDNDTDLENDASEAGTSDASKKSTGQGEQNWKVWKARYEGNTKTVNRLQKDKSELEQSAADAADKLEEEKSALQLQLNEAIKARKTAELQLNTEKSRADDLDGKLKATQAEREQRKKVVDLKNPTLLNAFDKDLLRKPTEFKTPEEYDAYLKDVQALMGGGDTESDEDDADDVDADEDIDDVVVTTEVKKGKTAAEKARAVVPPVGGRKNSNGTKRSTKQVMRDLDKLDIRNPDHAEKIQALEAELISATD